MATQTDTLKVRIEVDDSGAIGKLNQFKSASKSAENGNSSFVNSLKSTAGGMMIANAATAGFNVVMGQVGSAVERADKLRNFTKTLQLLGIGADDAKASTDALSKGIDGLPTTLDSVAGSTQRLVASGLGIGDATKMTLALNDAFLASGSSTAEAENAMTQYSQILATGKVDQQSWNSLVIAMPGGLKKVSEQLLGAGSSQAQLKKALQDGTVSMDQFNQAMIKADGGAQGFHAQAKQATDGIGTGFQNMKNRITKGLATAIESFNKFVQDITGMSIGEILGNIGTLMSQGLSAIGPALKSAEPAIKNFINTIKNVVNYVNSNKDWLMPLVLGIGTFAGGITLFIKSFTLIGKTIGTFTRIAQTVTASIKMIQGAFALLTMNPFILIVVAIVAVVAGLTYFFAKTKTGQEIWNKLTTVVKNFFSGIGNWLGQAGQAIANFFNGIKQWFTQVFQTIQQVIQQIIAFITPAINVIVTVIRTYIQIITTIIKAIVMVIQIIVLAIVAVIMAIILVIVNVIKAGVQVVMGIFNAIRAFITVILNVIKMVFTTVFNAIKAFVTTVFMGMQLIIVTIFNFIKNSITNILHAISTVFHTVFTPIIQFVSSVFTKIFNVIKSVFTPVIKAVQTIAKNAITGLKNAFNAGINGARRIFESIKDAIMNVLDKINLFKKGQDIIKGFIDGITSMAKGVGDAIGGIVGSITGGGKKSSRMASPQSRSISAFSAPTKMAPLMSRMAPASAGISAFSNPITSSIQSAVNASLDNIQSNVKLTSGGMNVTVVEQSSNARTEGLLQQVVNAIKDSNQDIVLDSDVLVGHTTSKYDKALGNNLNNTGRYSLS